MTYEEAFDRLRAALGVDPSRGINEMLAEIERAEKAAARVAELEGLLREALGWLQDPSAYIGTKRADDFDRRASAALENATPRHTEGQGT
jgi:hypothetical protein